MRILVVEGEARLAQQIATAVTEGGHAPTIVYNGESALVAATETVFDLITLAIILPGIDGFEVLRRLRSQHIGSRVLIVTARIDVEDRVAGLHLGADYYLIKPFAMEELVARVNALGRRYPEEPIVRVRVGDVVLDLLNHQVYRDTRRIELSARELMLLKTFLRAPGRVLTRTQLCEQVWEHAYQYNAKLVEVFIGRLRKKIGDPPLINTVRHAGYTVRAA